MMAPTWWGAEVQRRSGGERRTPLLERITIEAARRPNNPKGEVLPSHRHKLLFCHSHSVEDKTIPLSMSRREAFHERLERRTRGRGSTPCTIPQPLQTWTLHKQVVHIFSNAGTERTIRGAQDPKTAEARTCSRSPVVEDPNEHFHLDGSEGTPI